MNLSNCIFYAHFKLLVSDFPINKLLRRKTFFQLRNQAVCIVIGIKFIHFTIIACNLWQQNIHTEQRLLSISAICCTKFDECIIGIKIAAILRRIILLIFHEIRLQTFPEMNKIFLLEIQPVIKNLVHFGHSVQVHDRRCLQQPVFFTERIIHGRLDRFFGNSF